MQKDIQKSIASVWYVVLGFIGFILTWTLNSEKIKTISDPEYVPRCELGEGTLFSCKTVMFSSQASIFGIPNMYFGIAGFLILIIFGITLYFSNSFNQNISKIIEYLLLIGMITALSFSIWLAIQSALVIGSLCLYCIGIWIVSILSFSLSLSRVFSLKWFHMMVLSSTIIIIFLTIVILGLTIR